MNHSLISKSEMAQLVERYYSNKPITTPRPMRLRGEAATMAAYTGHHGPVTLKAVRDQIPQELKRRLTGYELGLVMSAVNAAYHNGRASHGGLDLCDDCVWIPWVPRHDGPDEGALIPIAALRTVKIEDREQGVRYVMDYVESENLKILFAEIVICKSQ